MTVNLDNLAAIFNLAKELSTSDGEVKEEELSILWDFFQTFGEMNSSVLGFIMSTGDKMSFEEACSNIEGLDDGAKQQISNLFAKIVCADGELTEDEEDLYSDIVERCGLPDPEVAEEPEDAITMLAERADVNLVQIIGRNGLLFKRNYDKPKIELP